jgi:hypothetical protein
VCRPRDQEQGERRGHLELYGEEPRWQQSIAQIRRDASRVEPVVGEYRLVEVVEAPEGGEVGADGRDGGDEDESPAARGVCRGRDQMRDLEDRGRRDDDRLEERAQREERADREALTKASALGLLACSQRSPQTTVQKAAPQRPAKVPPTAEVAAYTPRSVATAAATFRR